MKSEWTEAERKALDLLRKAGPLIHGERFWQSPTARDLGVADRSLRYWLAEKQRPPGDLDTKLQVLIRKAVKSRVAEVEKLRRLAKGELDEVEAEPGGDD